MDIQYLLDGDDDEDFYGILTKMKRNSNLDVSDCCRLLDMCTTDEHFFIALAYLPKILNFRQLNADEISAISKKLPINLFQRILSDQGVESSENYRQFVVDILSTILPYCSSEDILIYECLAEPLLRRIISGKEWKVVELEESISLLLLIWKSPKVEDVFSLLNLIVAILKEITDQLPSMALLRSVEDLLKKILEQGTLNSEKPNLETWTEDLRTVISRLLKTKNISAEYRSQCFILSYLVVNLLDIRWFESDPNFCILLASLTHVQFRLVLDDPKLIRKEEVVACATLGECFIKCIENATFLDDERATMVSNCCQESFSFVCEYLVECSKDSDLELDLDLEQIILRFICSFIVIGGAQLISKELINCVAPCLVRIAGKSVEKGDISTAEFILPCLTEIPQLPDSCLQLIMKYVQKQSEFANDFDHFAKATSVIKSLNDRRDWYDSESLKMAKEQAQNLNDANLTEEIQRLK